ncbi:DoxX family protein [Christiangramia aquimixticola]|uniref:DoxX family protein n=1 Tax=Christiangramia aquimixticola TaxID=1697558 RepID=UPI003AA906B7
MQNNLKVSYLSTRILRIFLSGIFLVASFNHLVNSEKTVARLEGANFKGIAYFFGNPELLVIISGAIMLMAGISFLLGIETRYAAIILALVLLPITLTVQVGQITTLGPLFKNIAIMGGLLFFIMNDIERDDLLKKPKKFKIN